MSLWRFANRTKKDQDFAEEIESHLAQEEDANLARGVSPEEARRQAYLRFGNPRTVREREWRYRSLPWKGQFSDCVANCFSASLNPA